MPDKYIYNNSGSLQEKAAIDTSAGAGDAGKIPALDAGGRLDITMMPTGVGADTFVIPASENLAAGDLVNIWNDAGTTKVRKANAGALSTRAHGYVVSAVTSPNNATVYFEGNNDQLSALTGGATLYLSETSGDVTATPPTTSTAIVQIVGFATSATNANIEIGQPIVLA